MFFGLDWIGDWIERDYWWDYYGGDWIGLGGIGMGGDWEGLGRICWDRWVYGWDWVGFDGFMR